MFLLCLFFCFPFGVALFVSSACVTCFPLSLCILGTASLPCVGASLPGAAASLSRATASLSHAFAVAALPFISSMFTLMDVVPAFFVAAPPLPRFPAAAFSVNLSAGSSRLAFASVLGVSAFGLLGPLRMLCTCKYRSLSSSDGLLVLCFSVMSCLSFSGLQCSSCLFCASLHISCHSSNFFVFHCF
jgi:hypothetical protein